jgi:hypothetical protein
MRQALAGFEADAKIVDAEKDRMRVRDIDRDQRNAPIVNAIGNDGRDVLVDLEFDDQVNALAHKLFRVVDGGGCVVTIVEPPADRRRQRWPPT